MMLQLVRSFNFAVQLLLVCTGHMCGLMARLNRQVLKNVL